jgi:hypothetical protein
MDFLRILSLAFLVETLAGLEFISPGRSVPMHLERRFSSASARVCKPVHDKTERIPVKLPSKRTHKFGLRIRWFSEWKEFDFHFVLPEWVIDAAMSLLAHMYNPRT